ncbi:glycosyltransferase [Ornithinimicrobium pekingense]|uniref:D-inositol 3-phosphate glycosyltransferase n=1 Tax=Ornithinimicrobium pekingense TaxID=384677 RepID=A0ABQ2F9M7_9MICO|nr:glycosyltransferase [Ornithinimicrobium pekingense]GGK71126.1 hypothetical protein GCM10011509_19450 [Ornithinimicrobium pekingense]
MTRPAAGSRLRIVFLATVLTPRLGMENALVRLAAALARHHDVEILVLHDPGQVQIPGVTVTSLDRGSDRSSRRALRRRLRRGGGAEILVVTGVWAAAQLLMTAPWRLRSAFVWEHSITADRLTTGRLFRVRAETVARCYRHCRRVVSVSPPVAAVLRERWKVSSLVVPNLLDLPARSPGHRRHAEQARDAGPASPGAPYRLITLGEARPVKNYEVLVRALPLLSVDWRLQMVGGGPQQSELRSLAEELGVGDRIEWLGFVPDPGAVLAGSDLLVHPSASETFGYALFEAGEQWLPVVAHDAPVMDSLVPQVVPGLLTVADPVSLAAAIESALTRFSRPEVASVFIAADQRRRRDYGESTVLSSWEGVLGG